MGMNKDHTVEELLAEIADSAARESDLKNRAEVAEAKLASLNDENINPDVYRVEDGHAWKESAFPTLRESGKCALCGAIRDFHIYGHYND